MKKLLAIILALCFVVTLCACGGDKDTDKGGSSSKVDSSSNISSDASSSDESNSSVTSSTNVDLTGIADSVYGKTRTFSFSGVKSKRDLSNTVYKLTKEKKLNVLFYGGSITVSQLGESAWSDLTGKWLKETYPDAEINITNKSISGQGTYLGLFRLERDAIPAKPDLMFIELATNDLYQGFGLEKSTVLVEAIVRNIQSKFPECDIVIVLTTDKSRLGTEFATLQAHRNVADYYGIPTINVGQALKEEMDKTGKDWDYYVGDIVHPNVNGHKVYADRVIKELKTLMPKSASSAKKHTMPSDRYISNGITKTQTITADKIEFEDGWEVANASNWCKYTGFTKSLRPKSTKQPATLTFRFEGTTFGMLAEVARTVNVEITIDGKETVRLHEKDATNEVERYVFDNLAAGEHVVTIKYNGPGALYIGAICIG
ncbi:MAG: hypothetical protein J6S00_05525 [Clostridia bacterium]|nr:hypothetical protein [Clostridia bacterium]